MQKNVFYSGSVPGEQLVDKRVTVPIGLTPDARDVVENIKKTTGVAKQVAIARVLEWFSRQSDKVQGAILHERGDAAAELVNEKMAEIEAAKTGADVSIEQATRVIRLMTDRIDQIGKAYQRELIEKDRASRKAGK